jgi:hypothetical protein
MWCEGINDTTLSILSRAAGGEHAEPIHDGETPTPVRAGSLMAAALFDGQADIEEGGKK